MPPTLKRGEYCAKAYTITMHFFETLLSIAHRVILGVMLVLTNTPANSLFPEFPPQPSILPPSGTIILTPTSSPAIFNTLSPAPFKNQNVEKKVATASPSPIPSSTTAKSTTTTKKVTVVPKSSPAPSISDATIPASSLKPETAAEPQETLAPGDLNTQTRAAIVNVLCNVGGDGSLNPISGTGIIIDSGGIVLTNAHVGQFFLLRDYPTKNNVDCVLRTGNPARATYRAQLLYFPIAWMKLNADKITLQAPNGTGERDYSFLYITGRTDGTPLPASFPYLSPYTGDIFNLDDETLLAGYPAGFIDGITVQTNLYVASAFGKINEIFTFTEGGGADLISVPGTIVSQRGASGGAVVRVNDGKLVGLIATATVVGDTSHRDLRAITLAHIDKSLTEDTGHNLHYLLTNDPKASARLFELSTSPTLTKMLTSVLNR